MKKKDKNSILIVDDEKNTRDGMARLLRRNYDTVAVASGGEALAELSERSFDLMLSDIRMPGMDGVTLMRRAMAAHPGLQVILLTAYGSIETAVEAVKEGACDYLTKPVNLDDLEQRIERAIRARDVEQENRNLHEQLDTRYGIENIIGSSPEMAAVCDLIRQVSGARATVMVEGESGTGKELVAHAIHRLSPRSHAPFVAVHCAALSASLLESELFGHEKGAFTGATERRKGRFESADGGTLFLDEIGEVDANIQVKILRVLEERRFERVGGNETIDVDVRIITATNRDLKKMVAEGTFREDLYYRLHVVPIHLPPLRQRRGDIAVLVDHFIRELSREDRRPIDGITPDALEVLKNYDWPGNVRELRNMVEHMVVMARGERITLRDVPSELKSGGQSPQPSSPAADDLSLEQAEKRRIEEALRLCSGNRTIAAKRLGISRRTLHRKLNEYGLREKL
jgi:two-component system, NtrC family, response regulator AtoC